MSKIVYAIEFEEVIKKSGTWPKSKQGALEESIRKYEWLLLGLNYNVLPSLGVESCALCQLYYDFEVIENSDCLGCPVREKTGVGECHNTPFDDYKDAVENGDMEQAKSVVSREIKFLKSLLPKTSR